MLTKERKPTTEEYWDAVATNCYSGKNPMETKLIRVNYAKVRYISKKLLEYDMTDINILEIGCGIGITSAMIRLMYMKNISIKATDVSPLFVQGAKEMFGLDTFKAMADNLPFEDNEFDAVFLFDVLEHIHPDEREQSYSEIGRVLKDRGMMFINNPLDEKTTEHDRNFDHGFKSHDLYNLCLGADARVTLLKEWGLGEKRRYQWITLEKN
ncbi:hypothetical protein LCGC14_0467270 [marine sediment metagenome]|uniref:Methyltransferase type 11 domain-containing protein n=1 Tax=marine sediment metagenome TaxID=412755 RepID=A0A0F9SIJ7_9ZZZZ